MEALRTLETKLAEYYSKVPQLPRNGRRWLATNAWWIILVIAILSTIGLLFAIPALFAIAGLSAYTSIYAYSTASVGLLLTASIVGLAFSVVTVVLLWMAISPLKTLRRRGWKLLFVSQVVGIVASIVSFIFSLIANQGPLGVIGSLFGLIWSLLLIAIELYFLFQVRGEFGGAKVAVREHVAKAVKADVVEAPKKK